MAESLEDRLRSHAEAFNGLLSLIPAKVYYGQDNSDQWQHKKQTKEERRAAKKAKLDPDNAKSAKDVMEENANKRKRGEEEEEELSEIEGIDAEKPKEGLKRNQKKQKKDEKAYTEKNDPEAHVITNSVPLDSTAVGKSKNEKRKEKRLQRKEQQELKAEKLKAKKARKEQEKILIDDARADVTVGEVIDPGDEIGQVDFSGLAEPEQPSMSTATPSPKPGSPVFDVSTTQSGSSSISSITLLEPSKVEQDASVKPTPKLKTNPEELKARLQQRLDALRAARHADTLDGVPARNRQELLEARRRKELQRKAHKKQLRQKAREEEQQKRQETLSRGSPLLSPAIMSPSHASPLAETNNFSFGRIAFDNGQFMTPDLTTILDPHKRKGPQDPRTALEAASKRGERLSALDPVKRADIEEKDVWLNARKRAHGERVRDDTSLLKKTLKRKEQAKRKSEKEWGERIEGIAKGKAFKQKKREENLQKRREEKGSKGKGKKKGKSVKGKKPKVRARPGFEGSFRAKVGGGSKKK